MIANHSPYDSRDRRFDALIDAGRPLERHYDQLAFGEGPCYFPLGDYLLFSDIPNNRMLQYVGGLGVREFRRPSNHSNGNARDLRGRLVTCEHQSRRVTRTELDGSVTVLADSFRGKRLNSPNDVVVKSDGSIWFTDPPYGIESHSQGTVAESELDGCYVFCLDPASGTLSTVADDFVRPNGLAFSPDEAVLYVSDTGVGTDGPPHIRRFEVADGRRLENGSVFAATDVGKSDGFRIDIEGNLWSSAGDGVHCFSPAGELLGKIHAGGRVSNVELGGPERNRLYMTGESSLFSVILNTRAPV